MKVLFWLSIGLDRRSPSEHLLTDMVEALYKLGHTVHILQKDTGGPKGHLPTHLQELGVETTRIVCGTAGKANLAGRFAADVRYVLQCRKWLRKHREFDRVFLQSSNVAGIQMRMLCRLWKNVPVVFNVQDIFPENAVYSGKISAGAMAYKLLAAMQGYAYRRASRIITISEDMKELLSETGVDSEKIDVVYNWSYSDEMYNPDEIDFGCLEGIIDRRKFNVVYAGNIGLMQNVELLIRAAARMAEERDICFHVIGEGLYRRKLERLAQELGARNVFFHDMLDAQYAPAIYSAADVNVVPLAKNIYRTALPSKTATCLACGRPIIFAIGRESKFGREAQNLAQCPVTESDDVSGLCAAILSIRDGAVQCNTRALFAKGFLKTANSMRYAEIILNSGR